MENKKSKWLYEFSAYENKDKIRYFALLAPNRKLRESLDLYYAGALSKMIKAGILPRAAFRTILENLGGTISEDEAKSYTDALFIFRNKSLEFEQKSLKPEAERSEEEKNYLEKLSFEILDAKQTIINFESNQFLVFENTAEAKARNKTILWLLLELSYERGENDEYSPIFKGESEDDKLDEYDQIVEKNPFLFNILRRINYLITLWFLNRIESTEDFAEFDKENSQQLESEITEDNK